MSRAPVLLFLPLFVYFVFAVMLASKFARIGVISTEVGSYISHVVDTVVRSFCVDVRVMLVLYAGYCFLFLTVAVFGADRLF